MKEGRGSCRFVPPQKSTFDKVSEAISETIDDMLSKISGRKKSPRRIVKEIKEGMILYHHKK